MSNLENNFGSPLLTDTSDPTKQVQVEPVQSVTNPSQMTEQSTDIDTSCSRNINTTRLIAVNETVYNIIPLLKVHKIWDTLQLDDQIGFIGMAVTCALIQYGCIIALLVDYFTNHIDEWSIFDHDSDNGYSTSDIDAINFTLAIKLLSLCVLSAYFFREAACMWIDPMLCDHLESFNNHKSIIHCMVILKYILLLLSAFVSIIVIIDQENPWDAFTSALAVTFILDVDNWIWNIVILHPCFNDVIIKNGSINQFEFNPTKFIDDKVKTRVEKHQVIFALHRISMNRVLYFWWLLMGLFISFGLIIGFMIFDIKSGYIAGSIVLFATVILGVYLKCHVTKTFLVKNEIDLN